MHVVFAIYNANSGGAVLNTARTQAEYLAECGDRISIVSNSCPDDWKNIIFEYTDNIQSRVWKALDYVLVGACRHLRKMTLGKRLDMYRVLPQTLFPYSAAQTITQIHREIPVDCCVCAQHAMAFGLQRLHNNVGMPYLLVSHGDIFEHPAQAFSIPMTLLYRRAARVSYRTANHIVAVSKQIKTRAIACGAHPDNITIIPNGIDFMEICGPKSVAFIRRAENEILYVGRLAAEKGVDVLLKALAKLTQIDLHLRLVGTGPMKGSLKALSKQLRLDNKCDFLEQLPRRELANYYLNSDMLVLPSLAEAQGVVTLEAQICGVPVIASNVGGIPDVIEHGKNGLLVPPGDSDTLAGAIALLCRDSALRRQMSKTAKQVSLRFAWPPLLSQFRDTVHKTIKKAQMTKKQGCL